MATQRGQQRQSEHNLGDRPFTRACDAADFELRRRLSVQVSRDARENRYDARISGCHQQCEACESFDGVFN